MKLNVCSYQWCTLTLKDLSPFLPKRTATACFRCSHSISIVLSSGFGLRVDVLSVWSMFCWASVYSCDFNCTNTEFIAPSMMAVQQGPETAKQTQIMILSPPCFTDGIRVMGFSIWSSPNKTITTQMAENQIWCLSFKAKKLYCGFVSTIHPLSLWLIHMALIKL